MHELREGCPYTGAIPSQETWQFNYRADAYELIGFLRSPSAAEKRDVANGVAQFALLPLPPEAPDAICLAHRFGTMPWSDSLYSWHLVQQVRPEQATIPESLGEGQRALLTVFLVDIRTRTVASRIRAVTLSPEFTQALHGAIRHQSAMPWCGATEYIRQEQALYTRYPDSADIASSATIRCTGGR